MKHWSKMTKCEKCGIYGIMENDLRLMQDQLDHYKKTAEAFHAALADIYANTNDDESFDTAEKALYDNSLPPPQPQIVVTSKQMDLVQEILDDPDFADEALKQFRESIEKENEEIEKQKAFRQPTDLEMKRKFTI